MMLVCKGCTTRFAVGLEACPQCGSAHYTEEGPTGTVPPAIEVACGNEICPAKGTVHRVLLRRPAPGVVEMPGLLCGRCGCQVLYVKPWPPVLEGENMPKITVHGGPSGVPEEPGTVHIPDQPPTQEAAEKAADEEGGEQSSAGSSSETSPKKPSTPAETRKPASPRRARTTASRSAKAQTAGSTARGTDGGQTEPTSDKS